MAARVVLPDVVTYSAAISSVQAGSQWQMVLDFCTIMHSQQILPNVITYSAVVDSYQRAFQWSQALSVFTMMDSQPVIPNIVCYTAMLKASENGGPWQLAIGFFQDMQRFAVQPNVFTYNTLFSSFDKAFQWHLALNLFSKMDKGPTPVASDTVSLAFVINSCAKGLQWQHPPQVLQSMSSLAGIRLKGVSGSHFRSINFSNEIWIAWKRRCRPSDKCNKMALGRSVADLGKHRWRASRGCSLHFGMSGLGHLCCAMWWCWALNDKPG